MNAIPPPIILFMAAAKRHLTLLALAGSFLLPAGAASDCSGAGAAAGNGPGMGPRHHPVGLPLPADARFNQPDGCIDGVWLFDRNRNRLADAGEIRLFGTQREIACASCHGESAAPKSAASANVFLRQDASTLCLACHNL